MINLLSSGLFSYGKSPQRENQDAILPPVAVEDGYLLAIADGVGSYYGSQYASREAINQLRELVNSNTIADIDKIFYKIKNGVSLLSDTNSNHINAATTLTFCYINPTGMHIGHVGDCRLYVKRNSQLKQITKDHTQHQKLLDEKIFNKSEIKKLSGKNTLTTAIAKNIPLEFQRLFFPIEELIDSNGDVCIYVMSDGGHHFWEHRPRFSLNTLDNPTNFSASLFKRIQRLGPIDDYSLISAKFHIEIGK